MHGSLGEMREMVKARGSKYEGESITRLQFLAFPIKYAAVWPADNIIRPLTELAGERACEDSWHGLLFRPIALAGIPKNI